MTLLKLLILLTSAVAVWSWYPYEFDGGVPGSQSYHGVHDGFEHAKSFSDEWTVVVEGGEEIAQLVALELGYVYGGPVRGFPDTYTFRRYDHSKQRRDPNSHTSALAKDRRVRWAEPQFTKSRVKRYYTPDPDVEVHRVKRIEIHIHDEIENVEKRNISQKEPLGQHNGDEQLEKPEKHLQLSYKNSGSINRETLDAEGKRNKRAALQNIPMFNDELWSHEWYLYDTRTEQNLPRLDLNVLPVYRMGFNGAGVRVSVLDDGIEHNHTDLRDNYDSEISWDSNDQDPDPSPRYEKLMHNSHGTRCAGEIAMTANNRKCGVGVAWGAKVGGVRMLDGRITDRLEGEAIGHAYDKVDIYSASWGPNDDGSTVEGPGRLATEAFKRGITHGRGGKGSIYVWANGNGGGNYDNCNCDGYSSSIYTISIGSASQHGLFPWYGEICSSTLAAAYSSGAYKDQKIATTDTGDSCTLGHTGTSAAAPLAAGIIALALQANPNLTWRDVQHLIVWTSEYAPLASNPGWQLNGIGLRFDVRFGFGLMNAGALVATALNWTKVPEKPSCRVEAAPLSSAEGHLSSKEPVRIVIKVTSCEVKYLEHVELIVTLRYTRRGALEIYLISPQGTKIQLLSSRIKDKSKAGFVNWPLMSVGTWGENPNGIWTVFVQDMTNENNFGEIERIGLVVHGTNDMPVHMRNGPRKYNTEYNYVDYFDKNIDKDVTDEVADDNNVAILPEEHKQEDMNSNSFDTTLLNEVEKELLRIHHRKDDLSFLVLGD